MFTKFINPAFIEKLRTKIGQSVVLFGLDGMSYFGKLSSILEGKRALLTPSPLSSSGLVEIQNPAEVSAVENQSIFDASWLVGFGFDITGDPFVMPNDNSEDISIDASAPAQAQVNSHQTNGKPSVVTLGTLGGFLFAGTLDQCFRNTAQLSIDFIFAPGGDGSTVFFINKAIVNLDALTSVSE